MFSSVKNVVAKYFERKVDNHEFEREVQRRVNERLQEEKDAQERSRQVFDNSFIGRPVIMVTNESESPSVAILTGYWNDLPVVDIYSDDVVHDAITFSTIVEYSDQRMKALMKLTPEERTSLMIKSYTYGNKDVKIAEATEALVTYEEIQANLEKNGFFEEAAKYYEND